MHELLNFQPSLIVLGLMACLLIVYTCHYYMVLVYIILRCGGVTGPNSGIVLFSNSIYQ